MNDKKLRRWAELLLDIGKRNPLVNFRDTKSTTLQALAPDSARLFEALRSGRQLEVIDSESYTYEDNLDDILLGISESDEQTPSDQNDAKISKESLIERYAPRTVDRKHVLLYNPGGTVKAIRTVRNRGKTVTEETGINTIHAAFGFIHWTESEHSNLTYRAPLLLIPLAISNESIAKPFFIWGSDDEATVNPTFSYKLSTEHGITLPELGDKNLESYLDTVRHLVKPLGWTVSGECKIGLFSFLKMNMYRDLQDNAELILKNRIVRALLGNPDPELAIQPDLDENPVVRNPLIELHNVLDADSSQLQAIEMAKSGRSFVLEGPPGTGKSQTIANMIAELLYDGKRVLFVSEKQAALNVVYDKLSKVGMGDFCLELHSYKANKRAVIRELDRTLSLDKPGVSSRAAAELSEEESVQYELDAYDRCLHDIRNPIGESVYALINAYCSCDDAPDVNWPIESITSKTPGDLKLVCELLGRFAQYEQSVGRDYRKNPWYGCTAKESDYAARTYLTEKLDEASNLCSNILCVANEIEKTFLIKVTGIASANAVSVLLSLLSQSRFLTPPLFVEERLRQAVAAATELHRLRTSLANKKIEIIDEYDESIFSLDAERDLNLLVQKFGSLPSRLLSSEYRTLVGSIAASARRGKKPHYEEAVGLMRKLRDYKKTEASYLERIDESAQLFGVSRVDAHTDWAEVEKELSTLSQLSATISLKPVESWSVEAFTTLQSEMSRLSKLLSDPLLKLNEKVDELSALFDPQVLDVRTSGIEELKRHLDQCSSSIDMLPNWRLFSQLLDELKGNSLIGFVDAAIDAGCPASVMSQAYQKAFYRQLIEALLTATPELIERTKHDYSVNRFRDLDSDRCAISRAQVRKMVSMRRPNLSLMAGGSAVSTLRREAQKKTRQLSVRRLFAQLGDLVQILKPCFLMSPLSVSTLLSADSQTHFDAVIFDEASQIFPQDAIGSIYRGNQLIVVGDSKQMPPSSFFSADAVSSDTDEDTEDITDFESILDICSAVLPQLRLHWHYRSRCEELIAFSNQNFYNNTLITFPSAKASSEGIRTFFVPNGCFNRQNHTNRIEADRVVDLVFEDAKKHPERSLGVVAFSVAQMRLIESLVERRRLENPSYEEFFSSSRPEPFFVKNLESVQGDERDTIIFSVAYGRDATGRLLLNFGPLNKQGGERRLNVAVTRAKCNVQLVTSMRYTDIDVQRTSSEGARLLRAYLDYSENGAIALQRQLDRPSYEQFDSPFEEEVCDFLRSHGYFVDSQVGCSGFRIDLAVRCGEGSDYALAIECDGATYHSSKNARDRDRLRQSVLEGMGWTFYRIWSTDWFRNPVIEREKLLQAVRLALESPATHIENNVEAPARPADIEINGATNIVSSSSHAGTRATSGDFEIQTQPSSPSVEGNVAKKAFPEYSIIDISRMHPGPISYDDTLLVILDAVLKKESPLSEDWFLQRIAPLYGRQKATKVVKEHFDKAMRGAARHGISRHDGFIYLDAQTEVSFRIPGDKRSIEQISLEELSAGMKAFVQQNVRISEDDLFRAVAQAQDCHRIGSKVRERLEQALRHANGLLVQNGYVTLA